MIARDEQRVGSLRWLAGRPCQARRERNRFERSALALSRWSEPVRLDEEPAAAERSDLVDIFRGRRATAVLDLSTDRRREDELTQLLRRVHAAVVRSSVGGVSKMPPFNFARVGHKVPRWGHAGKILRLASLRRHLQQPALA